MKLVPTCETTVRRLFALNILDLKANRLTGPIDFTKLSEHLVEFHVSQNQFSGLVDLSNLSKSMVDVEITDNNFTGTLDLRKVHEKFLFFTASKNDFSQIRLPSVLPETRERRNYDAQPSIWDTMVYRGKIWTSIDFK